MIADCTALIVAGGDSRRMGRDKASLALGEQTLLQRVLAVVQPLFADVLVSVRIRRTDIALPQVCDACPDGGPLAGLAAGLAAVKTSWIFAVATDMPFLRPALIERLASERNGYQAVVAMVDGHPQPLAAFYSISALPVLEDLLAGKEKRSLRAALTQLNTRCVAESELMAADPGLRSFFDLDTPQDLSLAIQQEEFGE